MIISQGVMQILQGNRTAMVTAHEFDVNEEFQEEAGIEPTLTVVQVSVVIVGGTEDAKDLTEKMLLLYQQKYQ